MPRRIQLKRTKGWRLPANTIVVTRAGKWGNPNKVHKPSDNPHQDMLDAMHGVCFTNEAAVRRYQREMFHDPELQDLIHREFAGKNVGCFCRLDEPCHGDVILEIARLGRLRTPHFTWPKEKIK